jgi:hypothetical protein
VGALGEYLAEFRQIPKDEPRRKKFEKRYAIVLIMGLAVELLGLVRTSQLNEQIIAMLNKQAQDAAKDAATANQIAKTYENQIADADARVKSAEAQIASANAASHEAVAKVANAEERIAEANRGAAEAVKVAETERLARVKIEDRLKPRTLNDKQRERIEARLKQYRDTPYELAVDPTPESVNFLKTIDTILRKSGWAPQPSARKELRMTVKLESGSQVEEGIFSNVTIMLSQSLVPKYNQAAAALVLALRAEGIETNYSLLPESDPSPDNIHVMVGSKE